MDSLTPPAKRLSRRRPIRACQRCRARRVQCDRAEPACANCVRSEVPCVYVAVGGGATNGARGGVAQPAEGMMVVQEDLAELAAPPVVVVGAAAATSEGPHHSHPPPPATPESSSVGSDRSRSRRLRELEEQVLRLTNEVAAWKAHESGATIAGPGVVSAAPSWTTTAAGGPSPDSNRHHYHTHDFATDPTGPSALIATLLPDQVMVFRLAQIFMDSVHPAARLLHPPAFTCRLNSYYRRRRRIALETEVRASGRQARPDVGGSYEEALAFFYVPPSFEGEGGFGGGSGIDGQAKVGAESEVGESTSPGGDLAAKQQSIHVREQSHGPGQQVPSAEDIDFDLLSVVADNMGDVPAFEQLLSAVVYAAALGLRATSSASVSTLLYQDAHVSSQPNGDLLTATSDLARVPARRILRELVDSDSADEDPLMHGTLEALQARVILLSVVAPDDGESNLGCPPQSLYLALGQTIRLAQALALHRDLSPGQRLELHKLGKTAGDAEGAGFSIGSAPSSTGTSPFELELRRRLWAQLCFLDVRAALEMGGVGAGVEPGISEGSYDAKLPRNLRDEDVEGLKCQFDLEGKNGHELVRKKRRRMWRDFTEEEPRNRNQPDGTHWGEDGGSGYEADGNFEGARGDAHDATPSEDESDRGYTPMTGSLVRCEWARLFRCLLSHQHYHAPSSGHGTNGHYRSHHRYTAQEREDWISRLDQRQAASVGYGVEAPLMPGDELALALALAQSRVLPVRARFFSALLDAKAAADTLAVVTRSSSSSSSSGLYPPYSAELFAMALQVLDAEIDAMALHASPSHSQEGDDGVAATGAQQKPRRCGHWLYRTLAFHPAPTYVLACLTTPAGRPGNTGGTAAYSRSVSTFSGAPSTATSSPSSPPDVAASAARPSVCEELRGRAWHLLDSLFPDESPVGRHTYGSSRHTSSSGGGGVEVELRRLLRSARRQRPWAVGKPSNHAQGSAQPSGVANAVSLELERELDLLDGGLGAGGGAGADLMLVGVLEDPPLPDPVMWHTAAGGFVPPQAFGPLA